MSDSIPPNNTEAERAFLGSVLLAPEIFNDFSSFIKPEDFYLLRNRHIWEVMRNLIEEGMHLDYLTLHDGLHSKGWLEEVGEDAYLIQMIQDTPTALHAESYARIIKDKANKRRIADLSLKVVQNAYSEKTFMDLHEDVGNLVTGYSALPGNSERLVYSAEQLCSSEVGELTWILKDWIMAGGINLIAGMPAAGKSFLALDLAIGIASTGFAWNDQPVPLGKVTYHFLDGSFRGMRSRVLKLCNARGIQPPANLTFDFSPLSLREPHEVLALKQRISSQGVSVVIFDVMAKFAPGADENSVAEMSPLMNSMREIANQLGTTFILIHHLNKGISNDFSYRVRGSTDILGSVDTAIIVNYENSSAANSIRVIQPQKMREAELPKPLRFQLVSEDQMITLKFSDTENPQLLKEIGQQERIFQDLVDYLQSNPNQEFMKQDLIQTLNLPQEARTVGRAFAQLLRDPRIQIGKRGSFKTYLCINDRPDQPIP